MGAFPGAQLTKARPAVLLSPKLYQEHRPEGVAEVITTQPPRPMPPTDCELRNWIQAGLHAPSYFRLFPITFPRRDVRLIGRLSESDGAYVQACLRSGMGFA